MRSRQGAFQADKKTMMISPNAHAGLTEVKTALERALGRSVTYTEVLEELLSRWAETGGAK